MASARTYSKNNKKIDVLTEYPLILIKDCTNFVYNQKFGQKAQSANQGTVNELKCKKKKTICKKQKQGSVTKQEYKSTAWAIRDGIRKDRAHLDLRLLRGIKGQRKTIL